MGRSHQGPEPGGVGHGTGPGRRPDRPLDGLPVLEHGPNKKVELVAPPASRSPSAAGTVPPHSKPSAARPKPGTTPAGIGLSHAMWSKEGRAGGNRQATTTPACRQRNPASAPAVRFNASNARPTARNRFHRYPHIMDFPYNPRLKSRHRGRSQDLDHYSFNLPNPEPSAPNSRRCPRQNTKAQSPQVPTTPQSPINGTASPTMTSTTGEAGAGQSQDPSVNAYARLASPPA